MHSHLLMFESLVFHNLFSFCILFITDYMEFTPHEVGITKYGLSFPTELYGNKFYLGKVIQSFDEVPIGFLMGA